MQVIGSYTYFRRYNSERSEFYSNSGGIQFAYGLSKMVDVGARYEHINALKRNSEYYYFDLHWKFSMNNSHFAFVLPLGIFDETKDNYGQYYSVSPQLLGTIIFNPYIDLTLGINAGLYLHSDGDFGGGPFGLNCGMNIRIGKTNWSLRPEFGYAFNPGDEHHFASFSMGILYRI